MVALGYEPLFDGKSLDGWVNPFEHGEAEVLDGELRLRGNKKFFLVTDRSFADFRLIAEIRLPEGPANSGVMFRCHAEPGRVYGYQAECDGSDRCWSGGLYDEGRRQWIWPSSVGRSKPEFLVHLKKSQAHFRTPAVRGALRRNEWNRYEITCIGDRIRISVNGVLVTDRRDSTDQSGLIGVQHHGEAGQVYRFRNLYLKELPEVPARESVELIDEPAVSIKQLTRESHLVDFGRVAFGNLQLTPPEGSEERLVIRFGEKLRAGRVDRKPPGTVRYSEVVVDALPGESVIVAPPLDGRNTGRSTGAPVPPVLTPPEWGVVAPFRWIEIEGLTEAPPLDAFVRRSAFPREWDETAAEFTCSDETLNNVWDLCRYSIKATAFAGVYVDGDRERIPYEADAYLNQLCHYFVEGDTEMARRTIDWLIENPTWPTEWSPHLVFMAHADWMQTGDVEWLKKRYPPLRCKVMSDRIGPSGFVESTARQQKKGDIVDWPVGERDGFVMSPINSVVNAFHLAGVDRLAEIARAVGAAEDADAYAGHADRFRQAFHEAFFDKSIGRYRDGLDVDHHAQHASFFPLAFTITPPEHRAALADRVANQGMQCSVYGAQYLLEALFENGGGEAAVRLITAPGDRSWTHMLNADATITWEAWDVAYKNNLDWNHAWGAAPANLLPRYVLGVRPLSPGWRRVMVHPTTCGLRHAQGVVPSPRGPVRVSWQDGERFRLQIESPDGVAVSVKVPATTDSTGVRVDGRKAAAKRRGDYWMLEMDLDGDCTVEVF